MGQSYSRRVADSVVKFVQRHIMPQKRCTMRSPHGQRFGRWHGYDRSRGRKSRESQRWRTSVNSRKAAQSPAPTTAARARTLSKHQVKSRRFGSSVGRWCSVVQQEFAFYIACCVSGKSMPAEWPPRRSRDGSQKGRQCNETKPLDRSRSRTVEMGCQCTTGIWKKHKVNSKGSRESGRHLSRRCRDFQYRESPHT